MNQIQFKSFIYACNQHLRKMGNVCVCIHNLTPEPVNMTLFGKRVFVDVNIIKLIILR